MRLVTPGDSAPGSISRFLLPHEHQVITVRLHPAILIPRAVATSSGLLVAIRATNVYGTHLPQLIIWILAGYLLLDMLRATARWAVEYFVATNQRLVVVSGISNRSVESAPLSDAGGITFYRTRSGRFLGYGTFIIQGRVFVDYVPYPEQVYLEVCGMLFPGTDDSDD